MDEGFLGGGGGCFYYFFSCFRKVFLFGVNVAVHTSLTASHFIFLLACYAFALRMHFFLAKISCTLRLEKLFSKTQVTSPLILALL